jgi:DNA-binding XRE family transcriptional regulator
VKLGEVLTIILPTGERLLAKVVEVDVIPAQSSRTPILPDKVRNLSEFGRSVKRTRESRGLTQRQLAKECKMALGTVVNIENNQHGPRGPNQASLWNVKVFLGL